MSFEGMNLGDFRHRWMGGVGVLTYCGSILLLIAADSLHVRGAEAKGEVVAVEGGATGVRTENTSVEPADASALKEELAACQRKTAQLKKKIKVMVVRASNRKAQIKKLQAELEEARQRPPIAPARLQEMVDRLRSAEKRLNAALDRLEKAVNN